MPAGRKPSSKRGKIRVAKEPSKEIKEVFYDDRVNRIHRMNLLRKQNAIFYTRHNRQWKPLKILKCIQDGFDWNLVVTFLDNPTKERIILASHLLFADEMLIENYSQKLLQRKSRIRIEKGEIISRKPKKYEITRRDDL